MGVFDAASRRLRSLAPYDAAAWVSADPVTGLPTGPALVEDVEDITQALCSEHWRREFVVDDVHLFRRLARAPVPAGALRASVEDPTASGRWRTFLRPLGFVDELRVVLRAGGTAWGTVTLWRRQGRPRFGVDEVRLVAALSTPLGELLRGRHRPVAGPRPGAPPDPPGHLLFDAEAHLVAADDAGCRWLDELLAAEAPSARVPTDLGIDVPLWMVVLVLRAAVRGAGEGGASARGRSAAGTWVACHAGALRPAGAAGHVAVTVGPAAPAEVAPIVADAYELTTREREVAVLVARGAGTAEIATALAVSPHTVRDHVRSALRKVGVGSRGELVATLFADHVEPDRVRRVRRHPRSGPGSGAEAVSSELW
jgi:DNA-binding CsgD family transcriptional regulator